MPAPSYKKMEAKEFMTTLPSDLIRGIDDFIGSGYASRSEVVRHAVRDFIANRYDELGRTELWKWDQEKASRTMSSLIEADIKFRKENRIKMVTSPSREVVENAEHVFGSNGKLFAGKYPRDYDYHLNS